MLNKPNGSTAAPSDLGFCYTVKLSLLYSKSFQVTALVVFRWVRTNSAFIYRSYRLPHLLCHLTQSRCEHEGFGFPPPPAPCGTPSAPAAAATQTDSFPETHAPTCRGRNQTGTSQTSPDMSVPDLFLSTPINHNFTMLFIWSLNS